MAIFSKRALQEMLNQNGKLLTEIQLKDHIARLNKGGKNSLPIEWEIVILNALSKLGHVRYEQSFGGEFPDLFFSSGNMSNISFLADITTVSDEWYEESNPVRAFMKETFRILRKNNIKLDGFHYEFGSIKGKRSAKLKIPPKSRFNVFFKGSDFTAFIAKIKENPSIQHNLNFVSDEAEIGFSYNPQGKYSSGRYASYNAAHSLTDNPVYNALKTKAKQLKKSDYDGTLAIFICDGGCNLLTNSLHDWQSYSLDNVISEFFRQYSSIHFILTFAVREVPYSIFEIARQKFIEVKIFQYPTASMVSEDLLGILNKFVTYLPAPVNTAINAVHRVRNGFERQGISFYGGSTVTDKTIKISSRGLLELLSERIDQKKFLQDHQFAPTEERPDNRNFFNLRLNEGRLITNIRLEKSTDKDDDWMIFEFGEPDPALINYKYPQKELASAGWKKQMKILLRSFYRLIALKAEKIDR